MAEYINKAELMEQYPEFDGYTFADVTTIDIVHCRKCKYSEVDKMGWYCLKYYHRMKDVDKGFCSEGVGE